MHNKALQWNVQYALIPIDMSAIFSSFLEGSFLAHNWRQFKQWKDTQFNCLYSISMNSNCRLMLKNYLSQQMFNHHLLVSSSRYMTLGIEQWMNFISLAFMNLVILCHVGHIFFSRKNLFISNIFLWRKCTDMPFVF